MAITPVQGKQIATASWANNAVSSSYALTASYALNAGGTTINTGSFVTTSSFNSFTSSYNTGSFTGSFTGSLFGTASWAVSSSRAITSSFAISSSYALSSSFAISSSRAVTSSFAISASQAQNAISSSYAVTSSYAVSSSQAQNAVSASNATTASYATTAGNVSSISAAITNNVNNYVLTATGTGVINGESRLTFDGNILTANGRVQQGDINNLADGGYSHAEGIQTATLLEYSHAEGTGSFTGQYGYLVDSIRDTYTLQINRDVASHFLGGYIIYDDTKYANIYGVVVLPYSSVSYSGTTDIVLNQDLSSGFTGALIGIPGVSTPVDYTHVLPSYTIASHAEGLGAIADGNASHAEGRTSTSVGDYSHAEGSGSLTVAQYSHAEGRATKTFGSGSHAEGINTITVNNGSHTEGNQTYTGQYAYECTVNDKTEIYTNAKYGDVSSQFTSVYIVFDDTTTGNINGLIEAKVASVTWTGTQVRIVSETNIAQSSKGYVGVGGLFAPTKADTFIPLSKKSSHAEGDSTFALGEGSHAEGYGTRTTGDYSSARGIGTIAQGHYQTIIGKYNIPSSDTGYIFIVGNGTSDSARSNALTIRNSAVAIPGTLQVQGGITGDLSGTASYATTASYALSGGSGATFPYSGSAIVTGSLTVSSSLTVTGSLRVSGSITGSLFGTSSWAVSSSNSTTASYVLQAVSSSYALSSSFAATSSYSTNFTISGSINNVDYIDFNPNKYDTVTPGTIPTHKEGRLFYDTGSQTLCMYNAEADVTLNVGQESWLRARNQTGTTITNGSVVKISGAVGNRPSISLAQARDQVQTFNADNDIIGMATHDIETGTDGFVTTFGLVNGVNTAGFTAGDLLWVSSSAGQYTNIAPSAPIDKTFVGVVTRANANNGTIFVTPNQPLHFHDISSVSASGYTQGDVWMFNQSGSSGVWTNTKTLSGSYSISGNLTVTGSIVGTSSWATNASTASYILNAVSSSFASTASFAPNYLPISTTGSMLQPYVLSSSTSSFITNSQTSSMSVATASFTQRGSGSFSGSFSGSGANLNSIPASAIVGLNLSQIATGSVTASVNTTQFSVISGSTTEFTVTGTGVTIGNIITDTHTVTGSLNVSGSVTATRFTGSLFGTSSWANNVATSSYVTTLNQDVLVTGSMTVGSSSLGASENTLTLGARDVGGEGGQLGFNAPGGTYTSASMLDNYQNRFRLLRGTNAGSDAEVAWWSMHTKQMALPAYNSATAFSGTPIASLGVDSGGNILTTGYYNYKNTTASSAVTGSTAETQVLQVTIPANTFASSDFFRIYLQMVKTGTSAASSVNIKMSTSSTMPAGNASRIALYTLPAGSLFGGVSRTFTVKGGNIEGFPKDVSSADGLANSTTTLASNTFNPAVTQYLYISMTNGDTLVSTILNSIQISNT